MIPRILHQVWCGKEALPAYYGRCRESFEANHPHWEHRLWTDAEIDKEDWELASFWNQIGNPIIKADMARYEIVRRHGGIYADTDFYWLRPLDDLLAAELICTAGEVMVGDQQEVYNGLFGASEEHDLLASVCEELKDREGKAAWPQNIFEFCGSWFFTRQIWGHPGRSGFTILPVSLFYPIPYTDGTLDLNHARIDHRTTNAYAIHLWGCSWMKLV